MKIFVRALLLSLFVVAVCAQAHGLEEGPARSILIRVSTSNGNENANLRRQYDEVVRENLAIQTGWTVRTESQSHLWEEEREDQFRRLGIEYYLTTSINVVDARLTVNVRLYHFANGLDWRKEYHGSLSDIQKIANDVVNSVSSWLDGARFPTSSR